MAKAPDGHIERNTGGNFRNCVLCFKPIDLDVEDGEYNPDWGWMHEACANAEDPDAH